MILINCPSGNMPECTTEFGASARMHKEFKTIGVELIKFLSEAGYVMKSPEQAEDCTGEDVDPSSVPAKGDNFDAFYTSKSSLHLR